MRSPRTLSKHQCWGASIAKRVVHAARSELAGQPFVYATDDRVLAKVHVVHGAPGKNFARKRRFCLTAGVLLPTEHDQLGQGGSA